MAVAHTHLDEAHTRHHMKQAVSKILAIAAICATIPMAYGGDGYRLLDIDGHDVKWGIPKLGEGASLTYTVVTGQTDAHGINNCRNLAGMGGLLANSKLTPQAFDTELRAAFAMWEKYADVRFAPAESAASADVVIASEAVADGVAYADVTPESSGSPTVDQIKRGIVCLNPDRRWTAAAADRRDAGKTYKLRYVLAHEIGHVLGLDHPGPTGELMSFEYGDSLDGLQPGDIEGIVALYGAPRGGARAPVVALNASGR